jgi:hypothetical protein
MFRSSIDRLIAAAGCRSDIVVVSQGNPAMLAFSAIDVRKRLAGAARTTVIVDATVIRGRDIPNKNIEFQILDPASQFPDMKNIWPGSIGVRLNTSLRKLKYDYTIRLIPWWKVDDENPERVAEKIGLLEIKFEYPLGEFLHRAWLLDCYGDPRRFEIISEWIDDLSNGQPCRIHIEARKVRRQ